MIHHPFSAPRTTRILLLPPEVVSQGVPPLPSERGQHYLSPMQNHPARKVQWLQQSLAFPGFLGQCFPVRSPESTPGSSHVWCAFHKYVCPHVSSPLLIMLSSLTFSSDKLSFQVQFSCFLLHSHPWVTSTVLPSHFTYLEALLTHPTLHSSCLAGPGGTRQPSLSRLSRGAAGRDRHAVAVACIK